MIRGRLSATALALAMGLGPLSALAQDGEPEARAPEPRVPVVVVAARPLSKGNAVAALWSARALLGRHPVLEPVDLAGRLGGGRAADAASISALLQEGQEAYDGADVAEAEKDLSIAALLASGRAATRPLAVQALSTLARLRAAQKNEKGAVRAFVRLLRLEPGFALDPALASPSATGRLDAARRIIDEARPARLRVESEDVTAAVFIDGRLRGTTPLYVSDLPSGTHHMRIAADGFRDDASLVEPRARRETAVQVALLPSEKVALFEQVLEALPDDVANGDASAGLRDLKALSFAEQAIVLAPEPGKGRLVGALYDLKSLRRVRVATVELDDAGIDAGRAIVRALYRGLSPRDPGSVAAPPMEEPEDEGVRWWLWGSIAAGAAVAVAVPIIIFAADDDQGGVPREPGTGGVILRF